MEELEIEQDTNIVYGTLRIRLENGKVEVRDMDGGIIVKPKSSNKVLIESEMF